MIYILPLFIYFLVGYFLLIALKEHNTRSAKYKLAFLVAYPVILLVKYLKEPLE